MSKEKTIQLKSHLIFWSALTLALFVFVGLFKSVLLPFILGAAIAYLLAPLVDKMTCMPRLGAVCLILLLFFILVAIALFFAVPPLIAELRTLIQNVPSYIDSIKAYAETHSEHLWIQLNEETLDKAKDALMSQGSNILKASGNIVGTIFAGGSAFINLFSIIILTPLIAFFMMKDWLAINRWINQLIPQAYYDTVKTLQRQMNAKVSGFVRGQISIAITLGVIYAFALYIADLNYGLLIGFTAGLLSIIPLLGSTTGLIVSLVVAWFQAGELSYVLIIGAIFAAGQFIEGNILTPKFLGDNVGMHPVWILFSVMAGAHLYGIVGMLIAVPLAASVGVLLNYALSEYKKGSFYNTKKKQKVAKTKSAKAKK